MSYILDALKRAERERSVAAPETGGAAAAPTPRKLRPTTMALAGATLFLAGIGVAALLLRPAAPAQTPADAVPVRTPEATPPPAAASAPRATATAQPMLGDAAKLTAYESLDDVSPVFQGSPTGPATVAGVTTPATDTTAQMPAVNTQAGSAPGSPRAAPAAARNLPPRLAEMPDDYQSRFPSPLIQVHVFDAQPSRRWIMIDNRRHGEGGVLDSGLRIAEIVGDGVIFEFAGSRVYWPLNR